jgi:hypothetical protein
MAAILDVSCCVTDYLLSNSFLNLSFENKKYIIQLGRARPDMIIDYRRKDGFSKHFHSNLYDKYSWLTGSCKLNKMFCFPCLLFSDSSSVWSRTGFTDINNLTNSAKKHMQTEKHLRSCLSLHDFGNYRIETFFENTFDVHNRKVTKNRQLMERFIDTVVLLGKQELPFRGHDEKSCSINRGNYVEMLNYLSKYDSVLDSHLEQCSSSQNPTFSGLSPDIQNDLIHCIACVIRDHIKLEINNSQFVSTMIDETPDVSHREQLTTIFRYVTESGVEERFVGFFDVSGSRNADILSSKLIEILEEYRCKDKLIGQSYDGAAVMSGEHRGVQAKIREVCPMAVFVPCYAHILNLVLSRSLENISELKIFFGYINKIVRFFNKSSKRSNLLKQIADRRLPGVAETRWHYHSRIINVIYNCMPDLKETFQSILDSPESWDSESLTLSESFLNKLGEMQFSFLLHVFSTIFEKTDILFSLLQSKQIDVETARREIELFKNWISSELLNQFDFFYNRYEGLTEPPQRRRRQPSEIDLKSSYQRLFVSIIHHITAQIEHRYRSFSNLSFLDLLNKSKYATYTKSFPDEKVSSLILHFPTIFEFAGLKNELKVVYTTSSLINLDPYELFVHLQQSSLFDTFPQLLTLCKIFLTLPVTISSAERSFSALKRIHTYVRNSQSEARFSQI